MQTTGRREFIGGSVALATGFLLQGCRFSAGRLVSPGTRVYDEARVQLDHGVMCGAAVGCTDCDECLYVGRQGPQTDAAPVDGRTRFDLASLTKTVTASVCATLVTEGLLDADAPFTHYFPEHVLGRDCTITVRDLATHTSGFGDFSKARYSEDEAVHGGAAAIEAELRGKRPERPRGSYRYSCYNYVLLGTVAERAGGQALDVLAGKRVFAPLGMENSRWSPIADDGHIVTTPLPLRNGRLCPTGVVHDEIARHAGRPVGNAGLFSTLPDMLLFAEDLLRRRVFPKAHYELLFTPAFSADGDSRSFGFDMGEKGRPEGVSSHAIRHTGFTGQFLCVDPERDFAGVVLTTRRPGGTLSSRKRLFSLMLSGR